MPKFEKIAVQRLIIKLTFYKGKFDGESCPPPQIRIRWILILLAQALERESTRFIEAYTARINSAEVCHGKWAGDFFNTKGCYHGTSKEGIRVSSSSLYYSISMMLRRNNNFCGDTIPHFLVVLCCHVRRIHFDLKDINLCMAKGDV